MGLNLSKEDPPPPFPRAYRVLSMGSPSVIHSAPRPGIEIGANFIVPDVWTQLHALKRLPHSLVNELIKALQISSYLVVRGVVTEWATSPCIVLYIPLFVSPPLLNQSTRGANLPLAQRPRTHLRDQSKLFKNYSVATCGRLGGLLV